MFTNNYLRQINNVLLHVSGAIAKRSAYFGQGNGSILLDNVRCTGNETSIFSCPQNIIGYHNCYHSDDAGVVCLDESTITCQLLFVFIFSIYTIRK